MSLSSTSTLDEVSAAFLDNASYSATGSVTAARTFVTACRMLLLMIPKMQGSREATVTMNPELIQKEMMSAQEWLQATDTGENAVTAGPRVRLGSFQRFR